MGINEKNYEEDLDIIKVVYRNPKKKKSRYLNQRLSHSMKQDVLVASEEI